MIICPYCKRENLDESKICNHCGKKIVQEDTTSTENTVQQTPATLPPSPPPKRNRLPLILAIIIGALLLIGGATYFVLNYINSQKQEAFFNEEDSDDEMEQDLEKDDSMASDNVRYIYATHLMLRSTPNTSSTDNIIAKPSYGSIIRITNPEEIISDGINSFYYGYYDSVNSLGESKRYEGYVAADYVMTESDYLYLNSIFGDENTVNLIGRGSNKKFCGEARYKKALLDYFKKNNYVGNLSEKEIRKMGLDPSLVQRWQVFCRYPEASSNNVFHGNTNEGQVEFAVIIKNTSGERRLLCFCFDHDGNVTFFTEENAPYSGYLYEVVQTGYNSVLAYYDY